jgi:hypothetical protein
MEKNNKLTIYSFLNNILLKDINSSNNTTTPQEYGNDRVLIKGESPNDVRVKELEYSQGEYLKSQFFKVEKHAFTKAMQYEAARLPAYLDYEGMEYYPIIASALDLFMEETTTIGDDGKMLRIYSDDDRIRKILENFFYNTIDINTNLPSWARNLVKYGDNFVYMLPEKDKGITQVKQLVNFEMRRIETIDDTSGKVVVKFRNEQMNKDFNLLEVAHFRLLSDDKFLPYGCSILHKVRRVFRQLVMAEDAMLTYRILRAGQKLVYKIDVGNMATNDVDQYIDMVSNKLKRKVHVNRDGGSIDYRFNIIGNDEDIFMPTRGNQGTAIDRLEGASDLDKINDITYLRDNLFTGLTVPKPFLSFQQNAGEGKNLAMLDMRFSKRVNRVQQALIQELNKMAMTHLYLKGFVDAYDNFKLSLTNPSLQAESLRIEILKSKTDLYESLTRKNDSGFSAMSHARAKRTVYNMSEQEIIDDLIEQKYEAIIGKEIEGSPETFKLSGIYEKINKKLQLYNITHKSQETDENENFGEMENVDDDDLQASAPDENFGESTVKKNHKLIAEIDKLVN